MDLLNLHVPIPLFLAVAATLGYVFGRQKGKNNAEAVRRSRRDLRRAHLVAAELEKIAGSLRQSLATHHGSISRFRVRLNRLTDRHDGPAVEKICREVEEMLEPTQRLASEIASAYDEIRQQTMNLMAFTEVRTDPLTGVHNRRGLEDALKTQFALLSRYGTMFSVALFDIDYFKRINDCRGHLGGDNILQQLAKLLDDSVRETDIVARYGGEEFMVVMPQTELAGAIFFSERLRQVVEDRLSITISGGVACASADDTRETLVGRADSALYAAKSAGRNKVFSHDGVEASQAPELVEVF